MPNWHLKDGGIGFCRADNRRRTAEEKAETISELEAAVDELSQVLVLRKNGNGGEG